MSIGGNNIVIIVVQGFGELQVSIIVVVVMVISKVYLKWIICYYSISVMVIVMVIEVIVYGLNIFQVGVLVSVVVCLLIQNQFGG